MGKALKIRGDMTAEALRRAARAETDGRTAARMYARATGALPTPGVAAAEDEEALPAAFGGTDRAALFRNDAAGDADLLRRTDLPRHIQAPPARGRRPALLPRPGQLEVAVGLS